ncbi:YciI family protein [Alteromonas sp. P256]|uniref:YciI family protein n=1 Tax=Alteromonas sp. P256 TaxID=3117399 RepID=UPI002FE2E1D3
MLYIRLCIDKHGTNELREKYRQAHRDYLMQSSDASIVQAGPLCVSDSDDTNLGSFLIIAAENEAAAKRFHDNDPFTKMGLFETSHVHRWDKHIG